LKVHPEPLTDVTRYIESHKHLTLEDREAEFQSTMWRIERFKHVDETTRMLEIGIGTGWFPIMCKMKGLSCKGIEISPQLVEFAMEFGRRHGVEPDIEVGNVEDAELGESVYDIVIAASVFEHVEDWRRGIQTIYRALRPGGVLYFNSTNRFSLAPSQEYHFPLYGWLPDAWRYRLRKSRQGEDIMKLGIDFNQFTHPQLRRAFGFGDPIPAPGAYFESSLLDWFIPAAFAAGSLDPATVKRLNSWVPRPQDMDSYLPMVRDVLRQVVAERAAATRLQADYQRPFAWLVFAAAWQESCWRQFVARNDKRVPMESGSGDIGLMQINPKVWRGFYDLHGLRWDLVYNARAGADILAHHLLNYGVEKREHQVTGSVDSLARAAYAAYNGGPRRYDRYRRADASARERKVDALFFAKYREVKSGKELAVKACYAG